MVSARTYTFFYLTLGIALVFADLLIPLVLPSTNKFQVFITLFLSIILEAFPFVLLGTLISSLLEVLVSARRVATLIPKNKILGVIVGSFAGLIFPVCECAIIPVANRLMKKGVPLHMAIALLLAGPIMNPISIFSTIYAFPDHLAIPVLRVSMAIVIATFAGLLLARAFKNQQVTKSEENDENCCDREQHDHGFRSKLIAIFDHARVEFLTVAKFIVFGATLAALFQTYVPRNILLGAGSHIILSVLLMMTFAFVLSVCSEGDAFIARTFVGQFTQGSLLGFLVLGPMLDIKNTMVLFSRFKRRFVLSLMATILVLVFLLASTVNILGGKWS